MRSGHAGLGPVRRWWAVLPLLLGAALAVSAWITASGPAFHAGLVLGAAGLVGLSASRFERPVAITLCNTLAVILVGIVLIDRFWSWDDGAESDTPPTYSFDEAGGNPKAFLYWHRNNLKEQKRTRRNTMKDPRRVNPYVLRPGKGKFHDSTWWVNSLGFRGPEISVEKGNHYRIVALGESTTFGATHRADERPWPEILEDRIARDFACERPVQVINAGIPGWTLANNLARLGSDVFPLQPDLILSYHGYNGFPYILSQIPSARVGMAPEVPPRPSPLLARAESVLRVWLFRRRYHAARAIDARRLDVDVHMSRYAEFYRELVSVTQRRGIHLALATFSMAVTPESPEELILFYEPVFPDLRARILANRLHTRLVRHIAEQSDAIFIDTSDGLDGAYQHHIDPAHFTQVGRERLAAHFLSALRDLLVTEAGCVPRSIAPQDS